MAVAVVSPLWRSPRADSFPLSTYPMFSAPRERVHLDVAQIVDRDGALRPVPAHLLGSDEVLQSAATLADAVRRGEGAAARLCQRVAGEVAGEASLRDAVRIEIARQLWEPVSALVGAREPLERRVLTRCAVPRP